MIGFSLFIGVFVGVFIDFLCTRAEQKQRLVVLRVIRPSKYELIMRSYRNPN